MVDTPITQPLTAEDYEDRGVRAMHAVLIELGQILGPYRGAVVVVGGAVPYLLLRDADPPHVGTLDVDLDLDPESLAEGAYAELVETLERAGYRRDVEGLKPSTSAYVAGGAGIGAAVKGRRPAVTYVALDRRFVAWREEEGSAIQRLRDPRLYADDIDWRELQKHQRVVILAEAGSGKTEELRTQARALASEGSFAFYTTVHNAAIEGFAESLPDAERGRLAAWLASDKPARFFIDSVDEAKLGRIQLSTAFRKISDGIASGLRRAHVVLSGRITDWEFRAVRIERRCSQCPLRYS